MSLSDMEIQLIDSNDISVLTARIGRGVNAQVFSWRFYRNQVQAALKAITTASEIDYDTKAILTGFLREKSYKEYPDV